MFLIPLSVAASCYRLVPLPVEIWSTILRSLDPLSLLATARTDPVWLDICRGDVVLKKMLREGTKMEKKATFDAMMNPRLAVSTSRVGDKKGMFSQNVMKSVTHKKTTIPNEVDVIGYTSTQSDTDDHSSVQSASSDSGVVMSTSRLTLSEMDIL
ncbi:hypothetical protein JTB14_023538 [Gonioctena quinquepunctata]|nr:hypothetical protein JTB14_023538 [Gonioctena quinquepunctata]